MITTSDVLGSINDPQVCFKTLIVFNEKSSRKVAKKKVINFKNSAFFAPLREKLPQV
jgi:hypothetical protein